MSYKSILRDSTIHSSFSPLPNQVSNNPDWPGSLPGIGIIIRTGLHIPSNRTMADVQLIEPIITSPGKGEIVELDDLESNLRIKLVSLSELCAKMGESLLSESKRLMDIATSDKELINLEGIEIRDNNIQKIRNQEKERSIYDREDESTRLSNRENKNTVTKGNTQSTGSIGSSSLLDLAKRLSKQIEE